MGRHGTITPEIVKRVKEILKEGKYTHRQIAKMATVSPYTVYRINWGHYDTGKLIKKKDDTKQEYFRVGNKNWLV